MCVATRRSGREFPDVCVVSRGRVPAAATDRVAHEIGQLLERRNVTGAARVRLSVGKGDCAPMLVQVNLHVAGTPARVQAVTAGKGDLLPAILRLDRQITRMLPPWRPQPWPDRTRRVLTATSDASLLRRKTCVLHRLTPVLAAARMDAMDYDVHLFTDADSGEDAVVFRAGPSGLRLARQHHMHPPGWPRTSPTGPVPLIVNPRPTATLSEAAAVNRIRTHGLPFLFFNDPTTRRGRLLYPRHDGNLGMITPRNSDEAAA
jgi:hypothetical protein